ncbi:hypothetical protein WD277_11475 [Pseudomonas fragi]|uniref:hypothetical protein n=1 Tax=Pseudomonas fragi TaxID=296 RepID=UPI0030A3112F
MLFGPWRSSVIFALALAARPIVVLIDCFFNQPACDVRIYPLIELDPIKADTLGADTKFPDVGPDCFVEFAAAHPEIARCFAGTKNARQVLSDLCGCCVCHGEILQAAALGRHRAGYRVALAMAVRASNMA